MKLRLLFRRLTVSAPHMAVRSAMSWPLRWALVAVVLGFCAAMGLWAFEFGKDIAGLDHGTQAQLQQSRLEVAQLQIELAEVKRERDKAQSIANTADTLLTAEKVIQEKLTEQNRQLEAANGRLNDDLAFFEKLIPAAGSTDVAIRGLQAEMAEARLLKWQVLVIQARKNPEEFNGQLEISFTGQLRGKPWVGYLPGGLQSFKLKQYGRFEGVFEVPAQVVVSGVTAKVVDGKGVKSSQSIKL
jgi:hypothetical protein